MDKATRTYKLHRLLAGRRTGVPLSRIMEELECSRATANRIIQEMRDEFRAPIVFDRELGGYRLDGKPDNIELPGIWFSADELLAMLAMEQLLSQIGSSYLSRLLQPVRERVADMLGKSHHNPDGLASRIRLLEHMRRHTTPASFEAIAAATIARKQLHIRYHSRHKNQQTSRLISPQRMVHYRSNWYVDAWCHQQDALRRFSLDRIASAELGEAIEKDLDSSELDAALDGEYGAFTGQATQLAVLQFTAEAARWVADEQWHAQQQGKWLADGRYELTVPFGQAQELTMDILRWGPSVRVLSPPALIAQVQCDHAQALAQYQAQHPPCG
ncbi:helix-turn-helix transcriptional regulator [Chitinimonas sp.]|uniref:helix-turn-helix transcriptional regulator n=1 Tax=Chitinimonas sp. TaxID=1934313 RepID=UPI0035AFCC57